MNDNENAGCIVLGMIIGVFLMFVVTFNICQNAIKDTEHKVHVEAVKLNHGEWVVDENGVSNFSWKVIK